MSYSLSKVIVTSIAGLSFGVKGYILGHKTRNTRIKIASVALIARKWCNSLIDS